MVYCPLNANEYTEFKLHGVAHQIKIGNPSRELWIDGEWYDCYFNRKIQVKIGGGWHSVLLDGPLPNVKIGAPRPDLCLARVFLLLDGNVDHRIPIYLDQKPQLVEVSGKPHVLRFVEGFRTLTINSHPFRTDFGGFPMVISVGGQKHYLRLTATPPSARRRLVQLEPGPPGKPLSPRRESGARVSPLPPVSQRADSPGGHQPRRLPSPGQPRQQQQPLSPGQQEPHSPGEQQQLEQEPLSPVRAEDPLSQLLSLMPTAAGTGAAVAEDAAIHYNTHGHVAVTSVPPPPLPTPLPNLSIPPPGAAPSGVPLLPPPPPSAPAPNINDLWARLQSSGVLSLFRPASSGIPGLSAASKEADNNSIPGLEPMSPVGEAADRKAPLLPSPVPEARQRARRSSTALKEIQLVSHHASLKERQQAVVDFLFGPSDLQCKNCGLRFSPEDMTVYSAHLDWHFRAKRRERDNARKAQSRRWYYEKNDWIVSDEIEDDEQEMTEEEIILEQSFEIPTIPVKTDGSGGEEECPVCLEQFNQVYKQGEGDEEGCWHLHNAMRDESGVAYHPECFKDKEAQERETTLEETDIKLETTLETTAESSSTVKEELAAEADASTAPAEAQQQLLLQSQEVKMEQETSSGGPEEAAEAIAKTEPDNVVEIKPELMEAAPEIKLENQADKEEEVKKAEEVEDAAMEGPSSEATDEKATVPSDGEIKTETAEVAAEVKKKEEKELVEETANNNSLIMDAEVGSQAAVMKPQQKVDIKLSITSQVEPLERRESVLSQSEEEDTTEFDSEAIVVPPRPLEEREAAKPKLQGRKLTNYPPLNKDSELSGLCALM